MFRGLLVMASVVGAGLYTYSTAGTFDAEAIKRAEAMKPVTLTSQAYVRRQTSATSQQIVLPTRVARHVSPQTRPERTGSISRLLSASSQQTQAIVNPTSSQDRKSFLKFAEINPQAVSVMLQSELKRVGCYSGPLDGDWSLLSERAVRRFNKYAKTRLADDKPEGPAVVTVRQHQGQVCPSPCSLGRVRGPDGRCYEQITKPAYRPLGVRQAAIPGAVGSADAASPDQKPATSELPDAALDAPVIGKRGTSYKRKKTRRARVKRRKVRRSRRARRQRARRYRNHRIFNDAFGY